eukprot:jgi/Galph1/1090/GphlegSOOS_G5750.1
MSSKQQSESSELGNRKKRPYQNSNHEGAKFVPAKDFLRLSAQEKDLFALLLDAVQELQTGTTLRVAGGWVRDKLLGNTKDEPDIDLALDNMMGLEFANLLRSYLKRRKISCGNIAVIEQNPEQSKHLETARMKVNGISVDLVNLRKETYSQNSRIPVIEIGTPLEDAVRRDLTINSLFYNLNDDIIEDYTGKGLDDLRKRLIRTPLEPLITLLDDPLRALRAIRFAARFDFQVDFALYDACGKEQVHVALKDKVSRERIGTEIEYMLKTKNYVRAIGMLHETGILNNVLYHTDIVENLISQKTSLRTLELISLMKWIRQQSIFESVDETEEHLRLEQLGTLTVVLHSIEIQDKRKSISLADYVLRNGFKRRNKEAESVMIILAESNNFSRLFFKSVPNHELDTCCDTEEPIRLVIGRLLRKTNSFWKIAFRIGCYKTVNCQVTVDTYRLGGTSNHSCYVNVLDSNFWVERFRQWYQFINDMQLNKVWQWKPLINGNELLSLLPQLPKGPKIKEILEDEIDWIIMHPQGTETECREWLKKKYNIYS